MRKMAQVYTMCTRGYEGATPQAVFTFKAEDQKDADEKAGNWARYHGFSFYTDNVNASRSDVVVREAQGNELNWAINQEYVD